MSRFFTQCQHLPQQHMSTIYAGSTHTAPAHVNNMISISIHAQHHCIINSTCQQHKQHLHTRTAPLHHQQRMSTPLAASAHTHSTITTSTAHVNNISSICIHAQHDAALTSAAHVNNISSAICIHAQHHCIINGASQHLTQDLFIVHGNKKFQ